MFVYVCLCVLVPLSDDAGLLIELFSADDEVTTWTTLQKHTADTYNYADTTSLRGHGHSACMCIIQLHSQVVSQVIALLSGVGLSKKFSQYRLSFNIANESLLSISQLHK